jgi:hypothetical protein
VLLLELKFRVDSVWLGFGVQVPVLLLRRP